MATLALVVILITLVLWILPKRGRASSRLPPGPEGEFLFGNARQIPPSRSWIYYTNLAKQFGDVVHVSVFGQPIVALNSYEVIEDVIVKHSSKFSGRPELTMCGELVGWKHGIALTPPGPRLQLYRKLARQFLGPQVISGYSLFVESEMRAFVSRMLIGSRDFMNEFKFGVAHAILDLTYGVAPTGPEDAIVKHMEDTAIVFGLSSQPGRFLVDSFPLLKYVPAWFPFAEFKRLAVQWQKRLLLGFKLPFDQMKANLVAGVGKSSLTSSLLENPPPGCEEEVVKWLAGSLYSGAIDTSRATMATFLLYMVHHPEIQAKAWDELDKVVGQDRLPSLEDREDLPYIEAIFKETLRINPIAPLSLPYKSLEAHEYRGMIIPKDSIVLANAWAVSKDPNRYEFPEEFIPDRWLNNSDILSPQHYVFGFGRRVCPGQHLADMVIWSAIATVLATVNISKALDADGKEIGPTPEFSGVIVSEPLPFPYKVEPRSGLASALLHAASNIDGAWDCVACLPTRTCVFVCRICGAGPSVITV